MTLHHRDATACRQCGGLCGQGHPRVWVEPRRFAALFGDEGAVEAEFTSVTVGMRDLGGVPAPRSRGAAASTLARTADRW